MDVELTKTDMAAEEELPETEAMTEQGERPEREDKKSPKGSLLGYVISALSGILFVLWFSSWTSPIFKGSYGFDSAFFSMVGRAILEGKVMYRDYFDVKGPVFFFWEAFGQLLCRDRGGIFILQSICAGAAGVFLYKLCRLYRLKLKNMIFVFLAVYFIYATALWGGNSVEEYCLPLSLACLYFGLQFVKEIRKSVSIAFFFGLSFGIMLFSKVTVCAPMAALVLVVFIKLLLDKRFTEAALAAALFICGIIDVAMPVIAYFYSKGALGDMLLCAFGIAFKRGTDYYETFSLKWELNLIICYAGMALFIAKLFEKTMEKWVLLSLTVLTFLALHLGTPFDYYFITALPLTAYIAILICHDGRRILSGKLEKREMRIAVLSIAVASMGIAFTCAAYAERTMNKFNEDLEILRDEREYPVYLENKEVYDQIPEEDKADGLYSLESGMIFFEVNQILPTNRYPVNLPYFCELYPPAEREILNVINNESPKWIVAEKLDDLDNQNIKMAVYNRYDKYYSNGQEELWKLRQ